MGLAFRFERALKKLVGTKDEIEQVDFSKLLQDAGLADMYAHNYWPPMASTRELNHRIKSLKKSGVKKPFVSTEIRK